MDPQIFISPPFWNCPNCKRQNTFGVCVLWIGNNYYKRRCKECWYTKQYSLPELSKLVIYLDQFAISNMMKALNPDTKAYKKISTDDFWIKLFCKLDTLSKLQLIICPDSEFQSDESLISPFYSSLKRLYELLSQGVSFEDKETIRRLQICEHARNWIRNNTDKMISLDVNSIVHGDINAWQKKIILSVNTPFDEHAINEIWRSRSEIHQGMKQCFSQWQKDKEKSFEFWFNEDSMAFGKSTLKMYLKNIWRQKEISDGKRLPTSDDFIPSSSVDLVQSIKSIFKEEDIKDVDIWPKVFEYLNSPNLKEIPFNKIASMLIAAIARKASAGKRKPPNRGMVYDNDMISTLLPYCDALFIDKECHSYLLEEPLRSSIDFNTKLFSLQNKHEFMEYLNSIEQNAEREHIKKVEEVYGEGWKKPYIDIFEKKRK